MLSGVLIWIFLAQEAVAASPKAITDKIDRAYAAAQKDASEPNVFELASALIAANEYQESAKYFRFGISRYPKSARLRVGLGVALHGAGDYEAALQSLCAGADLDPKDTRALFFLGKMYDLSPPLAGEVTRRLERYAIAYPDNAAAQHHYAMSYWKSRNGQGEGGEARWTQSGSSNLPPRSRHGIPRPGTG